VGLVGFVGFDASILPSASLDTEEVSSEGNFLGLKPQQRWAQHVNMLNFWCTLQAEVRQSTLW
jgi:hypothetical protein